MKIKRNRQAKKNETIRLPSFVLRDDGRRVTALKYTGEGGALLGRVRLGEGYDDHLSGSSPAGSLGPNQPTIGASDYLVATVINQSSVPLVFAGAVLGTFST